MKKPALSPFRVGFLGFMLLAWVLLSFPSSSSVQQWAKTYGGTSDDVAYSIQQTRDGGYIVAGLTGSFSVGYSDVWVLKLDANGNVVWQKAYGGTRWDIVYSIQQTRDSGYIMVGEIADSLGAGRSAIWVLKLDANGNVVWQKNYGGGRSDSAYSIQQTRDGGYIVAGKTDSFGAGYSDAWVLKLDANGNIVWQKTYGGRYSDEARSIQQTRDGGYIVAGATLSFGAGSWDFWVLKLDANGNIVWQKTYGGKYHDKAFSIQQTRDGGYIVEGETDSFGAGSWDAWVLKLDANGNVVWQKTYGGGSGDGINSIQQTSDGGYIMAGWTGSFGAGSLDVWVLKLDANGNIGDCSVIGTSNAMVNNTSASVANTTASVSDTSITIRNTNATINNTNANITEVCYSGTDTFKR